MPNLSPVTECYYNVLRPSIATGNQSQFAEWNALRAELRTLQKREAVEVDRMFDHLSATGIGEEQLESEESIDFGPHGEQCDNLTYLMEEVGLAIHKIEYARAIELGMKDVADWIAVHISVAEGMLEDR